jgi:SAM-dependent methyltransferase
MLRRSERARRSERRVLSSRFVSAKVLPLAAKEQHALLTRPGPSPLDDGLPIPPKRLWERWGHTAEEYLDSGRADVGRMLTILSDAGAPPETFARVLDLGCAEGRMLRFFPRSDSAELWGVDINAERISWAQQHLPAPFRFATTTSAPHLPFEDNSFDLVYGISVFTHISDLADAWFLEVLRVLRPGGHTYQTIHDRHSVEVLLGRYGDGHEHGYMVDLLRQFEADTGGLSQDWVYFTILADPAAQVFYDANFLVEKWSLFADCLKVELEATGYQTAVVFRKRAA